MAANFFETGSGGSGNINAGDLQTIINARDASIAAQTAAQTAQALAESAEAGAASAAANVSASVTAANVAAAQAATSASTASGSATAALAAATAAATDADLVSQSVSDAASSATDAGTSASSAQAWASAPDGQIVGSGLESSKSYADKAAAVTTVAIAVPMRTMVDANFPYTLQKADLVNRLLCNCTLGVCNIVLPPGMFTDPGPTGGACASPVHITRIGTQNITFSAGGAGVIAPSRLIDQAFVYSTTSPLASYTPATAHRVVVPAGINRRLTIMAFSIHSTTAQATWSLTASNTSSLVKQKAESAMATGYFSAATGAGITGALWTANMADSPAATTNVDILPTVSTCLSYVIWAIATSNTVASSGYTGTSSLQVAATTAGQALTPAEAKDMLVFGLAMQGSDASPATLSGGGTPVQAQNSTTPGGRVLKDLTFIFGYEVRPDTTAETYTMTSSKSTESAKLGLVLQPDTSGGGSAAVILGGGTPTLSAAGKSATVWAHNDGVNYTVELSA